MRPVTVSVGPLVVASPTNIRTASSATLGAMVLNGTLVSTGSTVFMGALVPSGQAVLDTPRQVLFTTAASEAGHTVLVTGLSRSGGSISETVTLPSSASTVATVLSYAVLQSAIISANSTGTISIGTNGLADSAWVRFDDWAPAAGDIVVVVSGTINYSVQFTNDDPNSITNPVLPSAVGWAATGDSALTNASSTLHSSFTVAPTFARVLVNSQTNPGSLTATFRQLGTPA